MNVNFFTWIIAAEFVCSIEQANLFEVGRETNPRSNHLPQIGIFLNLHFESRFRLFGLENNWSVDTGSSDIEILDSSNCRCALNWHPWKRFVVLSDTMTTMSYDEMNIHSACGWQVHQENDESLPVWSKWWSRHNTYKRDVLWRWHVYQKNTMGKFPTYRMFDRYPWVRNWW